MRAFMSDRDGGPAYLDEFGDPEPEVQAFAARWAEKEARMILAETERGELGSYDFPTVVEIRRGAFVAGSGIWTAQRALADALRAFVESGS